MKGSLGQSCVGENRRIVHGIIGQLNLANFKKPTTHGQSKFFNSNKLNVLREKGEFGTIDNEFKHVLRLSENDGFTPIKTVHMSRKEAFYRNLNLKKTGFQWSIVDETYTIKL